MNLETFSALLGVSKQSIQNTLSLFENGATIPFIARYRKEKTGGLTDVQLFDLKKWIKDAEQLESRKKFILETLAEKKKLTDELQKSIRSSTTLEELEDIYLPFKEKKKTRAQTARLNGLLPLAGLIMRSSTNDFSKEAGKYINENYASAEDVLQGVKDIIAEIINESGSIRKQLRELFLEQSSIQSSVIKTKTDEAIKFKDYFNYSEPVKKIPAHRLLAILRGEREKYLRVDVSPAAEKSIGIIRRNLPALKIQTNQVTTEAVEESYNRLLLPSLENETLSFYKHKADTDSIKVFALNLKQLLLAPPLGQKNVLAIDPGYRSGCKIVCLDAQGTLLHNENIYPHPPQQQTRQAAHKISTLINQYKIDAIAIGDGTAGRETERFIQHLRFERKVQLFIVNEDGASIYSASAEARKEFPDYDVTVRGSVSIGRRLMDPLAELIKIDPKSVGVGQYQHDVDQTLLEEELNQTVETCVNAVGINVNTASEKLLTYVSGIGSALAKKVIDARKESNGFKSREELKKIKGFGAKAFEQSAGFLRILNGSNALDNSAVHPESYSLINKMAKDLKVETTQLIGNKQMIANINLKNYVSEEVGMPTLTDIIHELTKPGRDVRGVIKIFEFDRNIQGINDMAAGMILPGIVTNITNFGAFVDVGAKQDGLVHLSQLCDAFVTDVSTVVKLNQHVKVKVVSIDMAAKRIQFSMKGVDQS